MKLLRPCPGHLHAPCRQQIACEQVEVPCIPPPHSRSSAPACAHRLARTPLLLRRPSLFSGSRGLPPPSSPGTELSMGSPWPGAGVGHGRSDARVRQVTGTRATSDLSSLRDGVRKSVVQASTGQPHSLLFLEAATSSQPRRVPAAATHQLQHM
jgi:hypothetical protein